MRDNLVRLLFAGLVFAASSFTPGGDALAAPCGLEPTISAPPALRQAVVDAARALVAREDALPARAKKRFSDLERTLAPGQRPTFRRFFLHALCRALLAGTSAGATAQQKALARLSEVARGLAGGEVPAVKAVSRKKKALAPKKFSFRPMMMAPIARPAAKNGVSGMAAPSASSRIRSVARRARRVMKPLAHTPAPAAPPPPPSAPEVMSLAPPSPPSPAAPAAPVSSRRMRAAGRVAGGADCARLGDLAHGPCASYEAVIANLRDAPLAYNHPASMYFNRRTEVSLVLGTDGEDPGKALSGTLGKIVRGKTKISRFMAAELRGRDFRIEPKGRQEQLILMGRKTKWTWFVTALRPGKDKSLTLDLYAKLREGETILPPVSIRTFHARINVDVRWWDWLLIQARALEPIHGILAALAAIASFLMFFVRRRSRREGS